MHKVRAVTISIILVMSLSLAAATSFSVLARPLAAATDPGLGTAANASILSSTLLTNSGSSSTNRDVDVSPLLQVQPAGLLVGGAFHSADGVAAGVHADAAAAGLTISGEPLTAIKGPVLDGLVLVSGVYNIGAGQLNGGTLTLNGPGIYIFRASSSFVSSGSINFTNGARACDLYWLVPTLATINGSSFAGTIIAGTGVHFGNSVTLNGRALAIGGDVTLINDTITGPSCAALPATATPRATKTPRATQTPRATRTPRATQTPRATHTPGPSPTPKKPQVGPPNTGGGPIRNEEFPWGLVTVSGFSAIVLVLGIRAYRRTYRPKQ